MGFGVQTPGDKEAGCVVNEVVPGTTAEKYGVEVGDTLLRIGDEDITHFTEMREKAPSMRTMPVIFKNNQLIGGYSDLIDSLKHE